MRGKKLLLVASVGTLTAGAGVYYYSSTNAFADSKKHNPQNFVSVPKRDEQVKKLKTTPEFDILVIGGGATGSGAALDAATRGLNVALIEKDDFSAGTSSRSTKLIHGGVRYLENAVKKLDFGSLSLVFEALQERNIFMQMAPHLTRPLPIMTPCYKWWEIPYYYVGLKMYDLLAGTQRLYSSRYLGYRESLRMFPMLNKHDLKGSVVYYDGQMNDSRMNVSVALTAAANGAAVANHVEVVNLLKNEHNKITGATLRDTITGDQWEVKAKVIINATGPFSDSIRKMANPSLKGIIAPSSGVHIILPDYYSPQSTGLIVPKTKDGRVVFLLPWQGLTLAGTTDSPCDVTHFPRAKESEIHFILETIADYVNVKVRREDVSAAWSGIRPLVSASNAKDTASLSRDHFIEIMDEGLITIVGGKWTTYRRMSQDVINKAIEYGNLKAKVDCQTKSLALLGAENWEPTFFSILAQDYVRQKTLRNGEKQTVRMSTDIAQHLSESYGDRAIRVAELAQSGYGNRLADGYPYLEAEVIYAAQEEYACTAVDVLARRTRLAFLDTEAANLCVNRVVDLMGDTLKWDKQRRLKEIGDAKYFLHIMTVGKQDSASQS